MLLFINQSQRNKTLPDIVQHRPGCDLAQLVFIGDTRLAGQNYAVASDIGNVRERVGIVSGESEDFSWQSCAVAEQGDQIVAHFLSQLAELVAINESQRLLDSNCNRQLQCHEFFWIPNVFSFEDRFKRCEQIVAEARE